MNKNISRFIGSVWFFPSLLVISLILLSSLRINGSSIGVFYQKLFGSQPDSSLVAGEPRAIRSDEWGVNTPLVMSQIQEGFPRFNTTTGDGQDISTTIDVPYIEWSSLFKPQNWSFFVLPPEFAFAFKWWFLAVLLLLAGYTFSLSLMPKKYLISSLLAMVFFLSPFVHWWYQSVTILPLAYGLFIASIVVHLLRDNLARKTKVLLSGALFYIAVCFAFVLYVPFIVPVALVVAAFIAGHILNLWRDSKKRRELLKQIYWVGAPLVAAMAIFLLYIKTRMPVIEAISQSVYPGHRTEPSGGFDVKQLFGGYFNLQLQDSEKAPHLAYNQSEASSFILIFPFLIPLYAYIFVKRTLLKLTIDWRVVALAIVTLLFILRLFVPAMEPFFNLIQLNRIPHNRLIIGFGVVNFIWLVLAVQQLGSLKKKMPQYLGISAAFLTFIGVLLVGLSLKMTYDGYIESLPKITAIALLLAVVVWLFYSKKILYSLILLVTFGLLSVAAINPLYKGLGILNDSQIASTLKTINDTDGAWVVGNGAEFLESLPASQGVKSLSGIYTYPQLKVWEPLGTDTDTKAVYNRYAHVFFTVNSINKPEITQGAYFDPPALDAFRVNADPCSIFLRERGVRYILSGSPVESGCVEKIDEQHYPQITLFVYKLVN